MDPVGISAMVTGGASGLGEATARLLAARGAKVLIADVQDGEQLALELEGAFVRTDVTDSDQVQAAVDTATEMGPLRVLVNCAGIGPPARTLGRDGSPHDLGHFKSVIEVNLAGTFNCIRIAAAEMAAADQLDDGERGAIVNTASVAAYEGQIGQAAYSASKAGIVGMTLPVARDLASVGIRVNTIAPGIMDTPMLAGLPEAARESLGAQVLFPQRLGRPDEYADTVLFLITNGYINGHTIRLDGGIRMQPR